MLNHALPIKVGEYKRGNRNMQFTCIGFDVREWPWKGDFNADETIWEQNEEGYSSLIEKYGLKENEYQLLEIQDQEQLLEVSEFIRKKQNCNLAAIEFPLSVVRLQDIKYGYKTASIKIDLSDFTCQGLDVCDFNGLFSVLHNQQLGRNTSKLFLESQLIDALEFAQIANVFVREHSPYVIAKIYSLTRKEP